MEVRVTRVNPDELYHWGVKGMKWGVRKDRKSGVKKERKPRVTYEEQVRKKMEDYHKANPNRSKKDNYTIALRREERERGEKMMKKHFAAMGLIMTGVGAPAGMGLAVVNMLMENKKNNVLGNLMDEYNIERSKRVVNM